MGEGREGGRGGRGREGRGRERRGGELWSPKKSLK